MPVTYRWRVWGPHRVALRSTPLLDATVDGPHLTVDLPDPGTAAVVRLVVPDDRAFMIDDTFLWGPLTSTFFGPDGADLQMSPSIRYYSGAGTYHLLVGGGDRPRTFAFATPLRVDTALDAEPVAATLGDYWLRHVWQYFSATQGDVVSAYSFSSEGDIDAVRVEGPGGQSVPMVNGVFRIPETGEYRLLHAAVASWVGQLGVRRATSLAAPADGTPTPVTIDQPGAATLIHVDVPQGGEVAVTVDEVSSSLSRSLRGSLLAPDGTVYGSIWEAGTQTVTVTQPGGLDIVVRGAFNATGSLRVAVTGA